MRRRRDARVILVGGTLVTLACAGKVDDGSSDEDTTGTAGRPPATGGRGTGSVAADGSSSAGGASGGGGVSGTGASSGTGGLIVDPSCTTNDPPGQNDCDQCIREHCCEQWTGCLHDQPCSELGGDRSGGGPTLEEPDGIPDGEFFCFQDCVLDMAALQPRSEPAIAYEICAAECAERSLISFATNDLIACVVDYKSETVCPSGDDISSVCLKP